MVLHQITPSCDLTQSHAISHDLPRSPTISHDLQVVELQIVHETMLSARAGLPGHSIYNRVRNASEIVEFKMGSANAADALRLAALRISMGDKSQDTSNFPERLDNMVFDDTKMRPGFSESGELVSLELVPKQIPAEGLSVLLGALGDGAWPTLVGLPLVLHEMSSEDATRVIESGIVGSRRLNLCGVDEKINLNRKQLSKTDVTLVVASLEAGAPIVELECALHSLSARCKCRMSLLPPPP